MLKFDEQKQIDSVKGALALRGKIEEIVDRICKDGFKNICWLGIGGTYASCLQAEVHMKEKSGLDFFVENAAEYLTTGNKKVGADTIVVVSSVTGSTIEMVEGSVNDDKVTTDKELCWVAAEDFDQFPMATPQKKMIKTYEDSKKG